MIDVIYFPKSKKAYIYTEKAGLRTRTHKSPYAYISETATLAGKTFKFSPGLNILIGPNGSGKSTVIRACGQSLAAVQGGLSTITETWCHEAFPSHDNPTIIFPWKIKHTGRPAVFVDPRVDTGLTHRGAAFDNDFLAIGLKNLMFRGSTGEKSMSAIDPALAMITGKMPVPENWRISSTLQGSVNDLWAKRIDAAKEYLRGDGTGIGQATIILDEPESCLSIPMQIRLWQLIGESVSRYDNLQVIVATHSPFALNVEFAHYIELGKGYLEECRESIRRGFGEGSDSNARHS